MSKSQKIRLYPNRDQRRTFARWFGASRFVYNQTIDYLNALTGPRPHWQVVAAEVIAVLPEWLNEIPYQVKKVAVRDACRGFSSAKVRCRRTGIPFKMRFRSRKDRQQSCFVPKSAVKRAGLYPTISGHGLRYSEALPEEFRDCRLVCNGGRWYLCLPVTEQRVQEARTKPRVVSLDPGIRTFVTFYSPESVGFFGRYDFGRIARVCSHLDRLVSRRAGASSKRRKAIDQATNRLRWKVRDLVDEAHHQIANYLTTHFDVILLPTFETSEMVQRGKRRLRSKSVRAMLTWAHYRFERHLKHKGFERGKIVVDTNEAYTSKTASWTGEVIERLGGAETITSLGVTVDRDVNGARGNLIKHLERATRALGDTPILERGCVLTDA